MIIFNTVIMHLFYALAIILAGVYFLLESFDPGYLPLLSLVLANQYETKVLRKDSYYDR